MATMVRATCLLRHGCASATASAWNRVPTISRRACSVWTNVDQPQDWKYRLQVAAIIERNPVIHLEYNDFENLYIKHWMELNDEMTAMHWTEFNKYGVQYYGKKALEVEKELQNEKERLAREEEERQYQGSKGMAIDEEVKLVDVFEPAPKLTEDEHDHRALNRRLMGHLYLIVKNKDTGLWRFPQGPYRSTDGNYLRLCAKRHLQEHVGKRLRVHMVGNVPRHSIVDDDDTSDETPKPIKTFFYHGIYRIGDVKWNKDKIETHAWVNRDEMRQYFGDEYYERIEPVIFNYHNFPSPHIKEMI